MASRDYEKLSIEEFGKHLLDSNDLDPVYVALHRLRNDELWGDDQVKRWLVAYWCFYHCGVASWMSEHGGDEFWQQMLIAAHNLEDAPAPTGGRWPRGHERRHFRGQAGIKAVNSLQQQYSDCPSLMVDYILEAGHDFKDVSKRTCEHHLFGPWIGFKVGDMVERVLGHHVDFSEAAVFMFKDPLKSALMLWRRKSGLPESAKPKNQDAVIHEIVEYLTDHFKDYKAPPRYDRPVGLQEVETILCCWKSHVNGHYPKFNDIDDIVAGTAPWIDHSQAAVDFYSRFPCREENNVSPD